MKKTILPFSNGYVLALCSLLYSYTLSVQAGSTVEAYLDLPLEALLSTEVTSVSKKKQSLNEVAAAIFVINQEDIRRSGVTSLPEALRMAPGIHVGRIDANKWAISSRGFSSQFSNKLLVLIDGRAVYSPTFSGVYWDAQDTLLEDIERIEVIRGPGASIWGANALNGVINIITKNSNSTHGGFVAIGGGGEEKLLTGARYGFELGNNTSARLYVKYNDRDSSYAQGLDDNTDNWDSLRGGFRLDSNPTASDNWTFQGDIYDSDQNQALNLWKDPADPANGIYAPFYLSLSTPDKIDASGWNLLGKWQHEFNKQSSMSLQMYYDHIERSEVFLNQEYDTFDIDFQHQFQLTEKHNLIWGTAYRYVSDDFDNSYNISFQPESRTTELYSTFLQDDVELIPETLRLILGTKYEYNDYTGSELQPNVRLVWLANKRTTLWGSVSHAIRTPSRIEDSGQITTAVIPLPPPLSPVSLRTQGNENLKSETLISYEVGYRVQPVENISLDMAVFYNDYDELFNFEKVTPVNPISDIVFSNNISAQSYGLEMSVSIQPLEWWRIQSNYSFIKLSAEYNNTTTDPVLSKQLINEGSPQHQFSVRSMMDLTNNISLDLWLYHVDSIEQSGFSVDSSIPEYTSVNVRFAWHPQKNWELSLVGHNLFDSHHPEFIGESLLIKTEVERSVYGQIRWSF
jgi:iron complex outermembrane recepter protein